MESQNKQKEMDLLNKILEGTSETLSSLNDLSEEEKIIKIISAM